MDSGFKVGGQILLVSQFTLLGDARKGRRPDFAMAAKADKAKRMYEQCVAAFIEKRQPNWLAGD